MKNLTIFIPSSGRVDKQTTFKGLPDSWLKNTMIVVNANELGIYQKAFGDHVVCPTPETSLGINPKTSGICAARQWILQNTLTKYCLMLDDDMTFGVRSEGKLIKATKEDIGGMISLLESWLDEGFIHVGISARQHNFTTEEAFVEVARMNNAYAFNAPKVLEAGARFDRLKVMEDFDLTLSLLEAGFPNRVTYQYCWGQRCSGDAGGCSQWRTSEIQEEAARNLYRLHPASVKVVTKKSKEAWGGLSSKERVDVIISWKKAFELSKRKGQKISDFL